LPCQLCLHHKPVCTSYLRLGIGLIRVRPTMLIRRAAGAVLTKRYRISAFPPTQLTRSSPAAATAMGMGWIVGNRLAGPLPYPSRSRPLGQPADGAGDGLPQCAGAPGDNRSCWADDAEAALASGAMCASRSAARGDLGRHHRAYREPAACGGPGPRRCELGCARRVPRAGKRVRQRPTVLRDGTLAAIVLLVIVVVRRSGDGRRRGRARA